MDEELRRRIGALLHERRERLGVEHLLREERDYVLLAALNAEVSSGTFDQYLFNSSGDDAMEALAALERLGSTKLHDILRRVLDALPGGWCRDRSERWERMEGVSEDTIRELTDEYYDAIVSEAAAGDRAVERIRLAYQREGLLG
jgi:Domain of unknown function (DUF4375)